MKSWWSEDELFVQLSPEGWFTEVFSKVNFLWLPLPAAADAMVEQLCRNFHLYSFNLHVVILPWLMTSRWGKQLLKFMNLFIEIPFDNEVWSCLNF